MAEIKRCGDCQRFCRVLQTNRVYSYPEHGIGADFIAENRNHQTVETENLGIRSCSQNSTPNVIGQKMDACLVPEEFVQASGESDVASIEVQISLAWPKNGKRDRV